MTDTAIDIKNKIDVLIENTAKELSAFGQELLKNVQSITSEIEKLQNDEEALTLLTYLVSALEHTLKSVSTELDLSVQNS